MFRRFVVAIDRSEHSWRAVAIACRLAETSRAPVEVLHVVATSQDRDGVHRSLDDEIARRFGGGRTICSTVIANAHTPADAIDEHLGDSHDALLVLASHGRGRSAAVVGSVAESLIRRRPEPIAVIGPKAQRPRAGGPVILAIDGSDTADAAVSVGAWWMEKFDVPAWVVEVSSSISKSEAGHVDTAVRRLTALASRPAQLNVIHGRDVAREVADFAVTVDASAIVVVTHARQGLDRLLFGSVSADIVRMSLSPVLVVRAPLVFDTGGTLQFAAH